MIERLLITSLLVFLGLGVYFAFKQWHIQRLSRAQITTVTGQPTLLYFGSDTCPACPVQAHYLEQLRQMWHGRLAIQEIDAEVEPDKAGAYGVFTLPTTVIVDANGAVRQVNYGLTHAHKLVQQLKAVLE